MLIFVIKILGLPGRPNFLKNLKILGRGGPKFSIKKINKNKENKNKTNKNII